MQSGARGILRETFSSATATLVACVHCEHVSTREESFSEIFLGFPPGVQSVSREKRRIEGQITNWHPASRTLKGKRIYFDCCCEACGRLGSDRQMQISRIPEIFCFHVRVLVWTSAKQKKSHDFLNPLVWSLHAASLHCKQ